MMQLEQVAHVLQGKLLGNNLCFSGVTTDSRGDCSQRLFIALRGDKFDGHEFVAQAREHGAVAALVDAPVLDDFPSVVVNDTMSGLSELAGWWRNQFALPLIGITGSVGKTAVKEMLGAIFKQLGEGLVTKGNLNNEIGVPLTLLEMRETDLYAVVEMGMNHAGEISRLSRLSKPTIALINNAAAAHLDDLGSVEAVAGAKGEIFEGLNDDGIAVINADDDYAAFWKQLAADKKVMTFGTEPGSDVVGEIQADSDHVRLSIEAQNERITFKLRLLGYHNGMNALAAAAVAIAANVPLKIIKKGLKAYRPISGRQNIIRCGGVCVIDDTYNANPASVKSAIDVLVTQPGTTHFIMGDMAELGQQAQELHAEIGRYATQKGVYTLWTCGHLTRFSHEVFSGNKQHFESQADLIAYLDQVMPLNGAVLVKGSRAAAMETVVQHISKFESRLGEANAC